MGFYDHYFTEANENVGHSYSTVQIDLPLDIAGQVIAMSSKIANKYIYEEKDDSSYGKEDNIHVTVLYGLMTNNPTVIAHATRDFGPFDITLGQIKMFEAEKYDVLYIEVKSDRLVQLNKELKKMDHKSDHPDYCPHCTIAYVKKSFAKEQYKKLEKDMFKGIQVRASELTFCPANANPTIVPLLYAGGENRDDAVLKPKGGHTQKLDQPNADPDIKLDIEYGVPNVKTVKGKKDEGGFEFGMSEK